MEKILEFKPFKALLKMIGECMDFKGRTARGEFWWALLGIFILEIAVGFVGGVLMAFTPGLIDKLLSAVISLFSLAATLVSISMSIRRLHDVNKSPLLLLLTLIPVGGLVPLYFCTLQSHPEANQYGPVPTSIV